MECMEGKEIEKEASLKKRKLVIIILGALNIFISFAYAMLKKYSIEAILLFLSYAYFASCFIAIIIIITFFVEKIKQKKKKSVSCSG